MSGGGSSSTGATRARGVLRRRILGLAAALVAGLAAAVFAIAQPIVGRYLDSLETATALRQSAGFDLIVDERQRNLAHTIKDYADWDAAWVFMRDRNAAFPVSEIGAESAANLGLMSLVMVDRSGAVALERHCDAAGRAVPPPAELQPDGALRGVLAGAAERPRPGLLWIDGGPALMASRPIRKTGGVGEVAGGMVFIARLADADLAQFADLIGARLRSVRRALGRPAQSVVAISGAGFVVEHVRALDEGGAVVVEMEFPYQSRGQTRLVAVVAAAAAAGGGILTALATMWLVDRLVLRRITRFAAVVKGMDGNGAAIAASGECRRADELGALARTIAKQFGTIERTCNDLAALTGQLELEVAERGRMHQAQLAATQRLELVFAAVSDGFWDWDVRSGEVFFSDHWWTMLGYPPGREPAGYATWRALVHPDDLAATERVIAGALERGAGYAVEFRMRRADGAWKWILSRGRVVAHDRSGQPLRMAGTHSDSDDRKRFEAELIDARRTAEAADRAKSAFLAHMSHDIRTPLNGILGMVDLMRLGRLDDHQRERLEIVSSSGRGLLAILNDILDLSRIEAGRLELACEPCSPAALVREVAGLFRPLLAPGVELVVDLAPEVPEAVLGDAVRLRQILWNLVGNAAKFTRHGRVRIAATATATTSGCRLALEVSDTGVGIAIADQAGLFQPFAQAEAGRHHGGTGLGLSICQRLVTLMGGGIAVDSAPGRGSVFTLSIPLRRCEPAADAAPGPPAVAAAPRLAVLLVDDNEVNQVVATGMLSHLGHDVTVAGDGAEAVALATAQRFDAILMDYRLPRLDGIAATRAIRAHEAVARLPRTPIIALTADVIDGDSARLFEAGMDGHLAKPVRVAELAAALDRALAR